MDETILFPSPNWFLVSGIAVTNDGWLIYGGPSKSLCVLEPRPVGHNGLLQGGTSFQTHFVNRVNHEKILSIDVSPEWPEKRLVLTGSADGSAKLWSLDYENDQLSIKCTLSHDIHKQEKEEIVGVGFCSDTYAVTVGNFGHIGKWDLNSNIVKSNHYYLKSFRPTCVSCSPHTPLNVAVGTKQGVIFLIDLEGSGKLLYKVRGHNEEITNVAWCPQYNVTVKKALEREIEKKASASSRMDKIRQAAQEELKAESDPDVLEQSGFIKKLPDDSFDDSKTVENEDLFDMYKDPEDDEFGHKKFVSKDVLVKVKKEKSEELDYLQECFKLKEEILQKKNQQSSSIESLVEALDKTHVNDGAGTSQCGKEDVPLEASDHIHKHLLASISKNGSIRIWSKSGKLVASCMIPSIRGPKNNKNRVKNPTYPTVLWYKPDVLLIADSRNQVLTSNPLVIDGKNRMKWKLIHSFHKRGLFYIGTDAPRVQDETTKLGSSYSIWTAAQDRNIVKYSFEKERRLETLATCGGFIYSIAPCPYDARKIAVSVGDGAIRVTQCDTLDSNDKKLGPVYTTMYWQNVQGKVLSVAWHPTKENLLAFGTAESRVGVLDTSGRGERAAVALHPSLRGGVYSLCWARADQLYASGGGDLYLYTTGKPDQPPEQIKISVDNIQRQVTAILYTNNVLMFGTLCGGVGVLKDNKLKAAMFVFNKMIHTIVWHPQQTSNATGLSQFKDLIAVCSMDRNNSIVILEYKESEDGETTLRSWKTLQGHLSIVSQLTWNPHVEGQLLSTGQDSTVRVWSIESGACVGIFAGHSQAALSGSWAASPQLGHVVLSGGGDCCVRMWDIADHPVENFNETKCRDQLKKEKRKVYKKSSELKATEDRSTDKQEQTEEQQAFLESNIRIAKKFLVPLISKQISQRKLQALRAMFNRYLQSTSMQSDCGNGDAICSEYNDIDFIKMFGTINEVNELLDLEISRHKENASIEASIMLSILRGQIDTAVSLANEYEMIDSFILSIAPSVSFKYWKDVNQLYLNQLDRFIARQDNTKLGESRYYGGTVYHKIAALLSIHDVKGAVNALIEAKLHRDAYILCRTRHMDSFAEDTLVKWAAHCAGTGNRYMAAICHFALGNLSQAAIFIGESNDQDFLTLAVEVAEVAGQTTFAQRIELKKALLEKNIENIEEELDKLPSRIELMMNKNGQSEDEEEQHGEDDQEQNAHSADDQEQNAHSEDDQEQNAHGADDQEQNAHSEDDQEQNAHSEDDQEKKAHGKDDQDHNAHGEQNGHSKVNSDQSGHIGTYPKVNDSVVKANGDVETIL